VAHLYAYFDQSGHESEHAVVALSGFVDGLERWRQFQDNWCQLLRSYELPSFRTVQALRYSQPYGKMEKGDAEKRTEDILPFVRTIRDSLQLGITVAVDISAYRLAPSIIHQSFGDRADYFAFYEAIVRILRYFAIPRTHELALIYDEEDGQAARFYQMLRKMKLAAPEIKQRVTSICFCNDVAFPPLQAADLLAYFSRKEAERRFFGREYEFRRLHSEFETVHPESGKHLHFAGGFFDKGGLEDFAEKIVSEQKNRNGGL